MFHLLDADLFTVENTEFSQRQAEIYFQSRETVEVIINSYSKYR